MLRRRWWCSSIVIIGHSAASALPLGWYQRRFNGGDQRSGTLTEWDPTSSGPRAYRHRKSRKITPEVELDMAESSTHARKAPPFARKPIVAYNDVVNGTSIEVDVQEDALHPGKFFVDGLRDAIANYKRLESGPSAIKIFHRAPDGDEIKDGELPTGITEVAFQLPGEENPVAIIQRFVTKIASGGVPVPAMLVSEQRTRRVGRDDFQEEVQGTIEEIFKIKSPIAGQSTTALVLPNASGTGKTFSTITFPTLAQEADPDRLYLLAYIGFNITWSLKVFEEAHLTAAFLSKSDQYQSHAVRLVVTQRLLHVLALLLASKGNLRPYADSDVFPLMPLDLTAGWYSEFPTTATAVAKRIDALEGSIVSMAKELHEQQVSLSAHDGTAASAGAQGTGKKPTVILVNLDEAQQLDELVKPSGVVGLTGGARYALRCLRELQKRVYDATDGKCLLLPVATGINPRTALCDATCGQNIQLNRRLLAKKDFLGILTESHLSLTPQQKKFYGMVCYPRVRTARSGTVIKPERLGNAFPVTLGPKLLEHALSATPLDLDEPIPRQFVSSAEGVPFLDLAVWDDLNSALHTCARTKFILPISVLLQFSSGMAAINCYHFESLAFHVIGYTLALFWNPTLVEESGCQKAFCGNNPEFSKIFRLPTSFVCSRAVMDKPNLHFHPFHKNWTHDDAYKGPLSESFISHVRQIKPDEGIWMWCGGRAPLDYILIFRDQNGKCHARYGDAKHRSDTSASAKTKSDFRVERQELAKKASDVHAALTEKLDSELSLVLDPAYEVVLVTNTEVSEDPTTTTDGTTDTVHILCPNNFNFEPFTPILFRTCVE